MRLALLLSLALVLIGPVAAQGVVGDDGVYVVVDEPPTPVGGMAALIAAVTYPEAALADGAEGLVFVTLVVGPDGAPRDVTAARAPHPALAEAAREAVAAARFTPGRVGDDAVPTRISLPVRFALPAAPAAEPARPIGGWDQLMASVAWPTGAIRLEVAGEATLEVEVEPDGTVRDAVVLTLRTEGGALTDSVEFRAVDDFGNSTTVSRRERPSSLPEAIKRAIVDAVEATRFVPEVVGGETVPSVVRATVPFAASR